MYQGKSNNVVINNFQRIFLFKFMLQYVSRMMYYFFYERNYQIKENRTRGVTYIYIILKQHDEH